MRPEDLKSPFTWQERRILIHDRIWYVPDRYENFGSFSFPGWHHSDTFSQKGPIYLEYCSGNGAWISAKARAHPKQNWVAIERNFSRVRKIWSKIKNDHLPNLLVVSGEGDCVTRHYLPHASVQAVYINFPDPWPKRRHAKNRLIQASFLMEIQRILKPDGILTMVTDDEAYSHIMISKALQIPGFQPLFASPHYVTEYDDYGTSYFEDLWRQKGKIIRYHAFRKSPFVQEV